MISDFDKYFFNKLYVWNPELHIPCSMYYKNKKQQQQQKTNKKNPLGMIKWQYNTQSRGS